MWNVLNSAYPVSATNTGTTAVTATLSATSGLTYYITDISCSADHTGASFILNNGSTAMWQDVLTTGVVAGICYYSRQFLSPIKCTVGSACTLVITNTAGSTCTANIAGYAK